MPARAMTENEYQCPVETDTPLWRRIGDAGFTGLTGRRDCAIPVYRLAIGHAANEGA